MKKVWEIFDDGDVYIDFPYEDAKFRRDKQTGKYYRRFYGQAEEEIPHSSALLHDALSSNSKQITREEYFRD